MYQVTIAAEGRERLFPDEADLLRATRAVARIGGPAQLLFGLVDEHAHSVIDAGPTAVAHIAGSLSTVLARLPGGRRLEPARIRPVNGRSHLVSLVPYVVTQVSHHGLAAHPAAWAGSCLADLIGARRLPGFARERLEAALPRYPLEEAALRSVGLDWPLDLPSPHDLRSFGARRLWRAVGAAIGVCEPRSNRPEEVAARVVYAALAREAGIVDREAREAAGLARPTWYRLLEAPIDRALLATTRLQIGLQQALSGVPAPGGGTPRRLASRRGRTVSIVAPRQVASRESRHGRLDSACASRRERTIETRVSRWWRCDLSRAENRDGPEPTARAPLRG